MRVGRFRINVDTTSKGLAISGALPVLKFQCNVCGSRAAHPIESIERESASCSSCGSTLRFRSVVHLLSMGLFGESISLPQFPKRKDLKGIGMTDWPKYAKVLESQLNYVNTFYHQEPRFDLLNPADDMVESLDFVISSEVLEHIAPPVQIGFDNLFRILKPNGLLVLTVPFSTDPSTEEHFEGLFNYKLEEVAGVPVLRNTGPDGSVTYFENLVFHGGNGATLEMRLFARDALLQNLKIAGFRDIQVHDEPFFRYGIYHNGPWSLPITARR